MTLAARLEVFSGRPMLLAVAALNLITGLAAYLVLAPLSFGLDAQTYRRGAEALAAGSYDPLFLYTPLAALVATPLTWIPEIAAAWVMTLIGLGVLTAGVLLETRGRPAVDRLLVFVAAVFFLPVINELLLGQITLLFAAALWPIVRWPDRRRNGIAFGIAMALAPKPAMLPVLLWMLLRRRQALIGVVVAGAVTLGAGLVLCGVDAHLRWLEVLRGTGSVSRHGNVSIWVNGLSLDAIPVAVVVAVLLGVCLWASEDAGLVGSLLAGLLLAPYTLVYSASVLLLVIRPAMRLGPWRTRLLALVANPLLIAAAVFWLGAGLLGTALTRRPSWIGPSKATESKGF